MTICTGQFKFILWSFCFCCLYTFSSGSTDHSLQLSRISKAGKIRLENPDSAIQVLRSLFTEATEKKDTAFSIRVLSTLASTYGNMANYRESYNSLWKALLLADLAQLDTLKVYIHQRIGRYYAFYKRGEKAHYYLDLALDLNKSLVESGQLERATLTHRYLAISSTYMELGDLKLAQTYLDSSFLFYEKGVRSGIRLPFLKMNQAFIYSKTGKGKEAIEIIEPLIPWFERELPTYLVLIYSHLGDAYANTGMESKSEWCYHQALSISDELHSHLDFSVLVHEKLASLYYKQGYFQKAFEKLKHVQFLDKRFFDSRSKYNHSLLEIQDKFRNALESKEQLLKEKRIAQLEHENSEKFLRIILFSVLSLSFFLFGILFFNYLRNKHRVEKRLIHLEIQAKQELLELKNKELAASALKLVEKDKFLEELKSKITEKKDNASFQEISHLIKTATNNNGNHWKAFESQFVAVNNGFFDALRNKYPKLTQGEKRLCALIKLKLTSKEIAGLMGISVESVHKSRYRLRKKLDLAKGVDLTDFMGNIA